MPKFSIVLIAMFFVCAALAQTADHSVTPSDPFSAADGPLVTFTQTWPDATPPFYSIAVSSTGRVSYQSAAKSGSPGDPYALKFTMSPEALKTVFQLTDELNHFNGDWEFKKGKIAYTGTKTLAFKGAGHGYTTTYNWSANLKVQQLTALFQNISETVELGRKLADTYRFDKLGVNDVLKSMEQAAKDSRLAEIQSIQPILAKIAKDPSIMNISRRRAEMLLSKVPMDTATAEQ
jgi:hypothetical protein